MTNSVIFAALELRVLELRELRGEKEKNSLKNGKNFPHLLKNYNLHIQEIQLAPSISAKRSQTYHSTKL